MKPARTAMTLVLVSLTMGALPSAMADDTPWYVGADIGQSRAKIDDANIGQSGGRFTAASISNNDSDSGYKLFGGMQFSPNIAFEAGYFDLGTFRFIANTQPPGTFTGSTKVSGLNLDMVGIWPITTQFSAFGRLGLVYVDVSDSFNGNGFASVPGSNSSKRDVSYKFGFGLQYDFTAKFAGRAEAERYRVKTPDGNEGDVDLLSVGVVYRFGD
jgi:OmpA-OmpF porin, OOP family